MFNKDIDVALIMREIQQKALSKNSTFQVDETSANAISPEIMLCLNELERINNVIRNTYEYTKAREETAVRIPYNLNQPVLIRKIITFIRRCVRKFTKFIWIEQNEVNKSLNANIKALSEAQMKIVECISSLSSNLQNATDNNKNLNTKIKVINDEQAKLEECVDSLQRITSDNIFDEQMYLCYEDECRGSIELIKQRLSYYIERFINPHIANKETEILLDIGCGRGEWLELMKENGFNAKGIDINEEMVNYCCNKGLDVLCDDAIDYLSSLPDESIKVITGFHIIEHIPLFLIVPFITECWRVLSVNGIMILETPNSGNLIVGANNFYSDPYHKRPVHKTTLAFVAKHIGFSEVELVYPQEKEEEEYWASIINDDTTDVMHSQTIRCLVELVKSNLGGSPDYAIVAVK